MSLPHLKTYFAFAAAVLLFAPFAAAHAAFSSTADTSTLPITGQSFPGVKAIVRFGNIVYVSGKFTSVGGYTGAGLSVATANGAAT